MYRSSPIHPGVAYFTLDSNGDRQYEPGTDEVFEFGLASDDPRIETLTTDQPLQFLGRTYAPEQLTARRYTFGRLTAGDFMLDKPRAFLMGKVGDPVCDGKTKKAEGANAYSICYGLGDLALGLDTLRKLHLYFAFAEQVLYVTPK